jgi:hypothetical protein
MISALGGRADDFGMIKGNEKACHFRDYFVLSLWQYRKERQVRKLAVLTQRRISVHLAASIPWVEPLQSSLLPVTVVTDLSVPTFVWRYVGNQTQKSCFVARDEINQESQRSAGNF